MKAVTGAAWMMAVLAGVGCTDGEGRPSGSGAGGRAGPADTVAAVEAADSALAAMAGRLLPHVEVTSGLRRRRPVRLATRTREQLSAFLQRQLDEALPEDRAERISAAYRRLGLLPDTLDLRSFLRTLYLEQVAGYYDPEADTLFVMEGSSRDQLRTVLVHEMVHALQDQYVDLDSLTETLERENDRSTAFQSAVEGHATYVMTEWRLGRIMGREVDLTTMPALMERIRASTGAGGGMPVFRSAPRIIRETLTFPYLDGMAFVQQLWSGRDGRPPPFDSLQPLSTEQVIHPARLAGGDEDAPTLLGPPTLPAGWDERYADTLGELEIRIFLSEHLGESDRASRLATGWDGDRVVLARGQDGREALTLTTVWDDGTAADSAATGLREALAARYGPGEGAGGRITSVVRLDLGGRPGVVMVDLPEGADRDAWLEAAAAVSLEEAAR